MAEYIVRQAALGMEALKPPASRRLTEMVEWGQAYELGRSDMRAEVIAGLKRLPAADVEPVRHGRWIPFHCESAGDIQYCSVCGIGCPEKTDLCPHCGARMDGEEGSREG